MHPTSCKINKSEHRQPGQQRNKRGQSNKVGEIVLSGPRLGKSDT